MRGQSSNIFQVQIGELMGLLGHFRNMGLVTGPGASTYTCIPTCMHTHTHVHLHITLFHIYFIANHFIVPCFPQPKIPYLKKLDTMITVCV